MAAVATIEVEPAPAPPDDPEARARAQVRARRMAEETLVGAVPVAGGGTGVASPPLNSANEAEKDDDSAPVGGAENDVSVAESLAAPCG